jgi:uncharacterized protein with von Willebrand factor type A (vWA) domain
MLGILTGFVDELRIAGIPVSMVEAIDAARGLEHVDLASRPALKAVLGSTLVKNARHYSAFEAAFETYFSLSGPPSGSAEDEERSDAARSLVAALVGTGAGGGEDGDSAADLIAALLTALRDRDDALLQAVVRGAVDRMAGIEAGRPVGGAYYLYRVVRRLELDKVGVELGDIVAANAISPLERRLANEEVDRQLERVREMVRSEIRRRLVADRGPRAVARTLRRPLVEDIDLLSATRDEITEIERVVHPMSRRLATRLSQRRRMGTKGRLDVRRTMRASLSTGGVPVDPRFRRPRLGKPEIVLLGDISGSVATFARFTMQIVFAISAQFSRVRSFAFIDGIDEVTGFFGPGVDFSAAMSRIGTEAEVVWLDGHSDYGNAFAAFRDRFLERAVTTQTTVIVTGDARSNYHDPNVDALRDIARNARALFWLNPESHRYWDTGDSIMSLYSPWCDEVSEVRNLRQLEGFVERVAIPTTRPMRPLA